MKSPLRIDYKHGGVDAEGTLLIPFTNRPGTQAHQGELKDMAEIIRRVNVFDGLLDALQRAEHCGNCRYGACCPCCGALLDIGGGETQDHEDDCYIGLILTATEPRP